MKIALANAQKLLPTLPLHAESGGIDLHSFDVAIAVNLDAPYRHAQDILWLQILAADMHAAALTARTWVLAASSAFETTGLVRHTFPHPLSINDNDGNPLPIFWNTPVLADAPAATVVRHPITGLRIGFVAHERARERYLPSSASEAFRLLTSKPTASSPAVGLAPTVWQVLNLSA
jgi:hypothetical protein